MHLSEIMEKWDGILYQLYNFFNAVKYPFLNRSLKRQIKENKHLKNAYEGKRCFIVLNGPSINNHDLSLLSNEYVFASNYFYRSDICKLVKPNFYCWLDSNIFQNNEYLDVFQEIKQTCPGAELFLNYKGLKKGKAIDGAHYTYNKHLPNIYSLKTNIAGICSNFSTVALYAICIAIYLGFKNIYILGLDFEPGAFKHFAKLGENTDCDDPKEKSFKAEVFGNYWSYAKSHSEFYKIGQIAKKSNANIFNLNKHSCVRSFEFAEYEGLFDESK